MHDYMSTPTLDTHFVYAVVAIIVKVGLFFMQSVIFLLGPGKNSFIMEVPRQILPQYLSLQVKEYSNVIFYVRFIAHKKTYSIINHNKQIVIHNSRHNIIIIMCIL